MTGLRKMVHLVPKITIKISFSRLLPLLKATILWKHKWTFVHDSSFIVGHSGEDVKNLHPFVLFTIDIPELSVKVITLFSWITEVGLYLLLLEPSKG